MPQQNYKERRQTRIDRLNERAEKATATASQLHDQAHKMASVIPFGQPILVGHHSERRDRNFRNKIHNKFGKAVEASDKAKHYHQKATAAESNRAISSDDPEAVVKLKEKIEKAEKKQATMRAANKIIRKKKASQEDKAQQLMALMNIKEATALKFLTTPDFCGRIGFPGYELTNNNANIRRMKERFESLKCAVDAEHKETEYEGFTVIENVEENRIQIIFDGKDAYLDLCKNKGINLRSHGFKYSKYNNAWQRHLNNTGRYATQHVIDAIIKRNLPKGGNTCHEMTETKTSPSACHR